MVEVSNSSMSCDKPASVSVDPRVCVTISLAGAICVVAISFPHHLAGQPPYKILTHPSAITTQLAESESMRIIMLT